MHNNSKLLHIHVHTKHGAKVARLQKLIHINPHAWKMPTHYFKGELQCRVVLYVPRLVNSQSKPNHTLFPNSMNKNKAAGLKYSSNWYPYSTSGLKTLFRGNTSRLISTSSTQYQPKKISHYNKMRTKFYSLSSTD